MASAENKRLRGGKAHAARKRQKLEEESPRPSKISISSRGTPKVVALDQLAWKEVALPDRFDDAEGFFGLEEIDDVEIVRDESNRSVQYRVVNDVNEHAVKDNIPGGQNKDVDQTRETQESSDWEGFDDAPQDGATPNPILKETSKQTTKETKPKSKLKKNKAKLSGKKVEQDEEGDSKGANAFSMLGAAGEAEEDTVDVSAWNSLNLSPDTLSSLAKLKFTKPTPIQLLSIPGIMNGHDVIGKASTGSGKTLAFGIPILEHYLTTIPRQRTTGVAKLENRRYPPVAMILSPTRELAHQLSKHLTELFTIGGTDTPRIATVTGGLSLQKQQRLWATADVIIGTPGRLWEVISAGKGLLRWLSKLKFLVLDEADRLLSDGHFKEVEEILSSLDREDKDDDSADPNTLGPDDEVDRQTLVFSATFQKGLQQKLAGKSRPSGDELLGKHESMEYLLKKLNFREEKPKFIDANPVSQMTSNLKEGIVECAGIEKDLYLYSLLMHYPNTRTLIFTNSIAAVRRLTPFLQNLGIPAHALHSQMPQKARLRSVERFSSPAQPGSILIATDIAARGLDIPSVGLIVHYHLPRAADMYVHRSGRTARGTKSGSSILLCSPEEVVGVRRLVGKVHARNTGTDVINSKFFMRTLDLNRRVVARLKPRVTLSKKIADSSLAKEKGSHEDNWLRTAADDLGVDYDSEEFAAQEGSKKGRGSGRVTAEKKARSLTKGELGALKGELKAMLSQRVNVGVSETYLSSGGVDVDALLEQGSGGEFLGQVNKLGL